MNGEGKGHPTPKAPQNQPAQQQIVVTETTVYRAHVCEFTPKEAGTGILRFIVPGGREFVFPVTAEQVAALGPAMTAPSVIVPRPKA